MKEKIGLALGSGGWRGLAYIGVIRSMIDHNIAPYCIAGSSMGALIGGLYAATGDIDETEKIVLDIRYRDIIRALSDPLARSGLVKGNAFIRFLRRYLGNIQIEDLNIKYAAVTSDIISGETIPLDKGDLVEAIRASISIPFIFSPVFKEERILVDGGLTDPVPVDIVRQLGAKKIIGVSVYKGIFPYNPKNKRRIRPIEMARVCRFSALSALAENSLSQADIAIRPRLENSDKGLILKMIDNRKAIEAGKDAADKALDKLSST
ncbi:MAG: patatin-like phospholipase family protein [Candidatus Colwellbacteria bacterium]|nr:patatin-like phospholipase family protein [Candidatus Colwellbacteria bacterium]